MNKPSMAISIINKTVESDGELLKLREFSSAAEFANYFVDKYEHLWDANATNETKKDLINLYNAIMEA